MHVSRNAQIRKTLAVVSALLWVILTVTLYFYVYKPFSPSFARSVGGALLDIAVMAGLATVAGGLGRWILSFLALDDWSPVERIAAAALLGYSCLAPLVLLVGAIMLNPVTMLALLVVTAVLTRRHLVTWLLELNRWWRAARTMPPQVWDRTIAVIVLWAVGLALLFALLPPTKWDVLTYHLAGAQEYVEHGRIYGAAHNHFLGFPQQVDVMYTAQLALTGRLTGGGVLQWAMGALMLLLVGGMTTRRFGLRAGLIAVSALIVGKSIWLEMTFAYSDLMPMGLAAIGLNVADSWSRARAAHESRDSVTRQDVQYAVLIGATSGFAMGAKYTTVWLGVALGVLVLWVARRANWRARLAFAAVYGLTAIVVLSPWLARNALWYDNPVYPMFFTGGEMDSIRQEWYRDPGSGMLFTGNAWQVPILPVAATILGVEGGAGYATSIGPLFLLLCPLLLFTWAKITAEERHFVVQALLLAGTITLIWAIAAGLVSYANQQTRLVLYMFPALAIIAGLVLESLYRLPKKPLDLAFVIHAMIVLTLVLAAIDYTQDFINSGIFTYFSGDDDSREKFLEQKLGWHYEAMRQVNALPPDSTVRFLWEPRYLYCDDEVINCHTDSLMDGWYYARRTIDGGDPASIARNWQEQRFDYLLVYDFGRNFEKDGSEFYTPGDWTAWEAFVDQWLEAVWIGGDPEEPQYVIYRWRRAAPAGG